MDEEPFAPGVQSKGPTPSTTPPNGPDQEAVVSGAGKYLTFRLGKEHYGLNLNRVREIIALMPVSSLPLTPECVRGVMNLRGRIIPVVDIRRRFNMSSTEDHDRKCIIVVDVHIDDRVQQMSLLVDEVSEVLHIGAESIQPPSPCLTGVNYTVVSGIARTEQQVTILLNVDRTLGSLDIPLEPARLAG